MDPTNPANPVEPAPQPVAADKQAAEPSIPKERLDQEISKRKSAEENLTKVLAELESLKKQPAAQPQPTAEKQGKQSDIATLAAEFQSIKDRDQRRELQRELSLPSEEHAAKVQEILKEAPTYKPKEALAVAKMRHQELFSGKDERAYDPGQHGSLRPTGNGPPQVETMKSRIEDIKKLTGFGAQEAALQRLHGDLALAAMGLKVKR